MLNKEEIKNLKKEAQTLKPIFQIGKQGVNEALIDGINQALAKRGLIKINILSNCPYHKDEVFFDALRLTKAIEVQRIGKTLVLYKKNPNKAAVV
jgi:RNA-binding protein